MAKFPKNSDSENWGYKFVRTAIDNFIRDVDGASALKAYRAERDRREHAEELLFNLLGGRTCLFYVRRNGRGQEAGEEIWEMIVASDRQDFPLPSKLKQEQKTLCLRVAVSADGQGLRILFVRLLPLVRGQVDGYAAPFEVRLLPNHQQRIGIPPKVLAKITTMPICGKHAPTEDQLQAWKAFLKVEETIARARQFCVSFVSHNYNFGTRQISFEIDVTYATLDGSPDNCLDEENFWQRVRKARNEDIKLSETVPTPNNWRNSRQIGSLTEIDPKRSIIRIRLERDIADYMARGNYQIPATGFLFFEAAGDINQIQRKKKALDDLNNGRTQNPYLGNF